MSMVCQWFSLKTTGTVFFDLTSKSVVTVCLGLISKPTVSFLVESQNQGDGGFPDLDLKISSSSLVIWGSKLPHRFLVFGLKTKRTMICQLHHKFNVRAMA
jgi:hypothetical protein